MRKILVLIITLLSAGFIAGRPDLFATSPAQPGRITIRTENYPRPPYSGATYYIYERDGDVICTKLQVCNKYDDCEIEYKKGSYKDEIDIETGDPYGQTKAVFIPKAKLRKHACLTKFKLL